MTGVIESIGTFVLVFLLLLWVSGGGQAIYGYFTRRQELRHKERMAKLAAKTNKVQNDE